MAIKLRIRLDSALALLAALGARLDSPDALLAPALPVVAAALERNFDEEGRPVRWTPLTPRYAASKARRFGAGLRILERTRHSRKLQRGAHSANGFIIRLTALQADREALEQRLRQIAAGGVPNYFGLQRFGFDGGNLHEARHWAAQGSLPEQRNRRSRVLSFPFRQP